MSQLTVYKASAGSGKTFQLTTEYLKIIFRNPEDFRYILAVTFTHKATAEMKARILKELHSLSNGNQSQICEILCKDTGSTPAEVFQKATFILKKILHHYSHFHISTIDSFFQGIINSFARDLGLQANFAIELNSDKVLNAVVDQLLINLEKDPSLARWLIDFAEEKVIQGESWELKDEIQKLGKELFREEYSFGQLNYSSSERKEIITRFRSESQRLKKEQAARLREIGEQVQKEIQNQGLHVEDFNYGWNGVMGYLIKLLDDPAKVPGVRAFEAALSEDKWASKNSVNKELITQLSNRIFMRLLNEAIDLYNQYFTLELLHSNIYTLGLLSDLQVNISSYAQQHNLFLLDQTPWLINRLMDANDAPFIYEKAGNHFKYFMIDEFQDTSVLQWKNFMPLIQNSLSQDFPCMIVGDVKQSIYRWRNSSWETLANMNKEDRSLKILPLNTNWRSRPLIIRFNNSLFTLAARKLQQFFDKRYKNTALQSTPYFDFIPNAYEDLKQEIPGNSDDNSGYAGIRFIEKVKESGVDQDQLENNNPDQTLWETKSFIDKLILANYRLKDIAILVRNKKEGTAIAEFLVNQNSSGNFSYRVISNDSLYLEKSSAVKLLVAVIQWILDDRNECNNLFLAAEFADVRIIDTTNVEFPAYSQGEDLNPYLPTELVKSKDRLSILPLFDLVENLIFLLKLSEKPGQYPYIQSFIDVVHDFTMTESAGVSAFLDWWKENSQSFTINAPDEQDAIRIITIHKSKGLEFKAVILPFCKWDLDHKFPNTPILWCDTSDTPYNELGLVPIRYKEKISDSIFAKDYYDEKIETYVDNLNLLYVAFTRAIDCLFAICEISSNKTYKIGNLLRDVFSDPHSAELVKKLDKLGLDSFNQVVPAANSLLEFGSIPLALKTDTKERDPVLIKKVNLPGNRIHVRAHTGEYFLTLLDPARKEKINEGLILHQALAGIKTEEDIKSSLQLMLSNGIISSDNYRDLEEEISDMMKDPIVKNWFTPGWKIMSESGIIEKGVGLQRPDRIMIRDKRVIVVDYKTGEHEHKRYHVQLKKYMTALRKMGFIDINGYIWYLRLKKVEEVLM